MKGIAIVSKGLESTASKEIKEIINAKYSEKEGAVLFDIKKTSDLCLLCYRSQSVDRILYHLGDFEFKNFKAEFEKFLLDIKLEKWMSSCKNFRVECIRIGAHDFASPDVEMIASKHIAKKYKMQADFKDNEIIFFAYIINSHCYFGVDFAGFEMNKRAYKIYMHPGSLRGPIAYALLQEAGFDKKKDMLDPFSRDGVVCIEAALNASNFPVNYYKKEKFAFLKLKLDVDFEKLFKIEDKKIKEQKGKIYSFDFMFKFIDFSRKNANIAGVDKYMNFSRTELEWLDIKFKKGKVDCIATCLPSSKSANLEKMYKEFFYQSEYILAKEGKIAAITKNVELAKKYASANKFTVLKEMVVYSGEQPLPLIVFGKE
ncbi:MAG: THUMP domain-containing protein [Nanoarchaeota archaeon]